MIIEDFIKRRNSQKREVAFVYNENNIQTMINEFSSLSYFGLDANFITKDEYNSYNNIFIVTEPYYNCEKSINNSVIQIVEDINSEIYLTNLKLIQYPSIFLKSVFNNEIDNNYEQIIMPSYPEMKGECELDCEQSDIIFFYGKDKPNNMIDELLDLDQEIYYEIKLYGNDFPDGKVYKNPSKIHKLSWNVTDNPNEKGFITYKILKELYNGCLPILLKENAPDFFKNYPFLIDEHTLKDKTLLIKRVKEMIHFISNTEKSILLKIAESTYNMIYYRTHWKKQFYTIFQKIESLRAINKLV